MSGLLSKHQAPHPELLLFRTIDIRLTAIHHLNMAQISRDFRNRVRKIDDDGADFESFVFECFRIAKDERGFSKRLARGRDGAIDLIDKSGVDGAVTVAECKYIGSGLAKEAYGRWAEVFRNLESNLPKLRQNSSVNAKSPYRAWLDPHSPVKHYRFCVTVAMSDAELSAIEARIAGDFAKLVALGVEEVRALAEDEGAVRVLRWDWFHAILDEHPALAFRWFRGLPAGIDLFAADPGPAATFRDFLTSGGLRYFSRDDYVADGSGTVERGEHALISRLANEDGKALLISGPGGVGKTRLSWEIAATLSKPPFGFDVYRLSRSARYDSITELAGRYPGAASILLLVDYAEAAPMLGDIAEAVAHVAADSSHRIRLVATCRASATNWVSDSLAVLEPEQKSLASVQSGEADYAQWVTRSILNLEAFPEPEALARICHGIPALAAFALFLFRRHPDRFDGQFGALHEDEDFSKWAHRRIAALSARLGSVSGGERELARIALALPFPIDRANSLSQTARPVLDALLADRWIEQDQGDYVAAHDVLADALVARWLFESPSAATPRAIDLLSDAAGQSDLAHALIALARLAPHQSFGEISGKSVIEALDKQHRTQTEAAYNILLGGPLLDYDAKVDRLAQWPFLKDRIKEDPTLQMNLSILADEATERKESTSDKAAFKILSDLLDDASNWNLQSNIILRRAYAFDPPRFKERAWANVHAFPKSETTHFLLVQMLRTREPVTLLKEPVETWLKANATAPRASFVYKAWLEADGETELVSGAVKAWVKVHETTPEASFVYSVWLEAGGGTELVADALRAWVKVHGVTPSASFVYCAWLQAGGGTELVADALYAWVEVYGATLGASFVYCAWLDARGGTEFIFEALLQWVEVHGSSFDAQFVYTSFLGADGGTELVSGALLAWLEANGSLADAQFVYRAWLDAGGATDLISGALLEWVQAHGSSRNAQFVYKAWLDAGGDFCAIQDHLYRWCILRCEHHDFGYLSKTLSKRSHLPESVILAIGHWCAAFPEDDDALFRLGTLIAHLPSDEISGRSCAYLLHCANLVFTAKSEFSSLSKTQIWDLCANLGSSKIFNLAPFSVARFVGKVVITGKIFDRDLEFGTLPFLAKTYGQITFLVLFCLRADMLNVDRDYVALSKFNVWLRKSTPYAARILHRVINEFPSAVWAEESASHDAK